MTDRAVIVFLLSNWVLIGCNGPSRPTTANPESSVDHPAEVIMGKIDGIDIQTPPSNKMEQLCLERAVRWFRTEASKDANAEMRLTAKDESYVVSYTIVRYDAEGVAQYGLGEHGALVFSKDGTLERTIPGR